MVGALRGSVVDGWLAGQGEGVACGIGDLGFRATCRVRSPALEVAKRLEVANGLDFDLVVHADPAAFGGGIEGVVDRYVAVTRAPQELAILTP
ncbi:hypothetical protein [Kribbella sp. NPDC049584]|uniref:hypothetical protein n=1 Tax=Kribbella sp. NPDC049584 TaxID=3154833 RepID=UPI003433BC5E